MALKIFRQGSRLFIFFNNYRSIICADDQAHSVCILYLSIICLQFDLWEVLLHFFQINVLTLWSMDARAKKWVTYLNRGSATLKATGGSCTCIYYIGSHLKWHKSFHTWDYFPESKGWCQLSHISSPVWKWHLPGKKFLLFWLQSTAQKSIYCNLINIT